MDHNSLTSWLLFLFKVFCATVIIITTAFTTFHIGPEIETRHFPVVSKMRIDQSVWKGPNVTQVWVRFQKLRNCQYAGMSWFRGTPEDPEGYESVWLMLRQNANDFSSPHRPTGNHRAGPWDVGIPEHEIADNSLVMVYHRCNPLWLTTTKFYP